MSKSSASRRISSGELFNLYPVETSLGWRSIRQITAAEASKGVLLGAFREVHDEHGNFWGYQIRANVQSDRELPSIRSSCSITVSVVLLIAGQAFRQGKSRTAGMSEEQRISRQWIEGKKADGRTLPPEDAVERATEKLKQWPYPASRIDDGSGEPVYGDRATRVYPQPA